GGKVRLPCARLEVPPPLLDITEMQRLFLEHREEVERLRNGKVRTGVAGDVGGATGQCKEDRSVGEAGAEVESIKCPQKALCTSALDFLEKAWMRAQAMEVLLWDPVSGLWRDLYIETGKQSPSVTPAGYIPLWAGLPWPGPNVGSRLAACVESLKGSGLILPGGVKTSTAVSGPCFISWELRAGVRIETGQQWDSNNAWPPLQWLIIRGLRLAATGAETKTSAAGALMAGSVASTMSNTAVGAEMGTLEGAGGGGSSLDHEDSEGLKAVSGGWGASEAGVAITPQVVLEALSIAEEVELSWLEAGRHGWERTGVMFEKYDASREEGRGGGGGEYDVQV
ncbi:unnamed protein product, partial [Choristocarpus tenellus]